MKLQKGYLNSKLNFESRHKCGTQIVHVLALETIHVFSLHNNLSIVPQNSKRVEIRKYVSFHEK
jgi:hypothetical protein